MFYTELIAADNDIPQLQIYSMIYMYFVYNTIYDIPQQYIFSPELKFDKKIDTRISFPSYHPYQGPVSDDGHTFLLFFCCRFVGFVSL